MIQGFGPGGALTPLESVRAVLGLQQDTVIREDKCTHFFTPDSEVSNRDGAWILHPGQVHPHSTDDN